MFKVVTHWRRVAHIYVGNLTIIGPDNGLSPGQAPSHYLSQCWDIVNWTLRNKLHWYFKPNSSTFIQKNANKNVVRKMSAILSRPQCIEWRLQVSLSSVRTVATYGSILLMRRAILAVIIGDCEQVSFHLIMSLQFVSTSGTLKSH